MKQKIILDCDPGSDDAINLFLAAASQDQFDILGVVAVAGNVGLDKTERNARILCEVMGRSDLRVFAGCDKPLKYPLATAEEVFGREGLDGVKIYEPKLLLQKQNGVDFIIDMLMSHDDQTITLVPTGPLTNIASAMIKNPMIVPKIKEIVLMGGAMREGGNITPSAEFNIYVDPHAAKIVFDAPVKKIVFGLDATYQVLTSKKVLQHIKKIGNSVSDFAYDMLAYYSRFDAEKYAQDGAPLHDPCTMAYLIKPEIFKLKECNISIEADAPLTRGHTSVDFWQGTDRPKNSLWCYDVDSDKFFDLLMEKLSFFA